MFVKHLIQNLSRLTWQVILNAHELKSCSLYANKNKPIHLPSTCLGRARYPPQETKDIRTFRNLCAHARACMRASDRDKGA